jgi:Tfp pilus assembly protein PilO
MKFSKTAQLILAIGIFAIVLVFMYRMNQSREAEHEQLSTQLATAQTLLPEIVAENEELEGRLNQLQLELNQAEASLKEIKAKFPASTDSIRYVELLCQMAYDRNLEMMSLFTSEPVEQTMEEVAYTTVSFEIEVTGQVADILDFVNAIAIGEDFTTAIVEEVDIRVPEPLTAYEKEYLDLQEPEEGEEAPEAPSADIKLSIYSYEGD